MNGRRRPRTPEALMSSIPKTVHEVLAVLNAWTGPQRDLLAGHSKTSPWLDDLDADKQQMERSSRAPLTAPTVNTRSAEQRQEAALRGYHGALGLQEQVALSSGDEESARRWSEVAAFIFDRGLSFLNEPQRAQLAGATRVLELSRHPSIAPLLAAPPLALDFPALQQRVADTTAAFEDALNARDAQRTSDAAPEGPSTAAALRSAIKNLSAVLRIARAKLPPETVAALEASLGGA